MGTAIAAVLVFVNPYGPSLVFFPLALMGRSQVLSNVAEWQAVEPAHATGLLYAVWLFAVVVALYPAGARAAASALSSCSCFSVGGRSATSRSRWR